METVVLEGENFKFLFHPFEMLAHAFLVHALLSFMRNLYLCKYMDLLVGDYKFQWSNLLKGS